MTKREIIDWVDNQWQQAINKHRENCDKQERAYQDKYLAVTGLRETADQVQQHLEQAIQLWLDWKEIHKGNGFSFRDSYYCLEYELSCFTLKEGAVYEHFLKRELDFQSEEFSKLVSTRQEIENNIAKSYSKLKQAIAGMKTVKDALAYLEKLGFDLSDLTGEKAVDEVDAAFLFPGKDAA